MTDEGAKIEKRLKKIEDYLWGDRNGPSLGVEIDKIKNELDELKGRVATRADIEELQTDLDEFKHVVLHLMRYGNVSIGTMTLPGKVQVLKNPIVRKKMPQTYPPSKPKRGK